MKIRQRILAGVLSLMLLVMLLPLGTVAAESVPELTDAELAVNVTVKQSESGLALTDSAAMLLRRAAIREGADKSDWRAFTESYVLTANGGRALSGSRTYALNGYSYTVKAYSAEGMKESDWTSLLSAHSEGVVLRFRSEGGEEKSVLLTHTADSVFYCLDPDPSTDAGFIDVCKSAYGRSSAVGGSQSKFFDSVTYYYAVSSDIISHTHTYGTEPDQLGVCQICGYTCYLENQIELSGKGTPAEGLTSFSMKIRPYSASDSLRDEDGKVLRFTSVNVLGVTRNHFGNVWYLVQSPDKKYSGYIWEANIVVSSSSAVIITGITVPENNAVAGAGARTEVAGSVRGTGAPIDAVTVAVYAYDELGDSELKQILDNSMNASDAAKLGAKRAEMYASVTNAEAGTFALSHFSSSVRFDKLSGGRQYLYAVTASDADGNSTTVYRAFYLSSGIETKSSHTVRLSVSGSVTEQVVGAGESFKLPEKSRTGYLFLGWSETESGEVEYAAGSAFKPQADVTLFAIFQKIGAPAVPKLTVSSTDAAVGETVSLQATASGADRFTASVYAEGSLLRTQSFRTGRMDLAFEEPGTYTVKAEAFAGDAGSGQSAAVTVTVHAPLTVIFMNGTEVWAEQRVDYGGTAAEPVTPSRPGSTFAGWDGSLKNIRENTVLNAEFTDGAYTVTFLNAEGDTLSRQSVAYNGSASAPDAPAKAGYTFLCWDTDAWEHVTEDGITVAPVYIRAAGSDPIDCALTGIRTVGSGKLISYTLTNESAQTLTGHAVLTGKTAAGKTAGTASGGVFVLAPGESFTESVYAADTGAKLWELTVSDPTGRDTLGGPVLVLSDGDGESELWVSESELREIGVSYKKLDESRQCSVSASETYSTGASSFLDWDKKSGSEVTAWGAWSDWQKEPVTAGKNMEVEKREVVTVPAHTEYRYGRWYAQSAVRSATDEKHAPAVSPSLAYAKSVYKDAASAFSKQFSPWSTSRFAAADTFRTNLKDNEKTYASATSGAYNWSVYYLGTPSENTAYFWEESRSVPAEKQTQYRYRVRLQGEEQNVFTHEKTPVWSFDSVKNADTRKVYHIRCEGAAGGAPVTLSGSLGSAAANRDAVLSVRMSDGEGHSNTYTAQVRLDAHGDYSIRIADMSALTVINAPCRAYLTVAGSTGSVCIGSFLSSGTACTVRFADGLTGELLSEQRVAAGATAAVPDSRVHEGYLFTGWNRSAAHITEDTVIIAEYEKETYTVVFSDSVAGTETAVSGIPYGSAAEAPEGKDVSGYTFIGWSVSGGSLNEVTGPMRAEAVYKEDLHTVTYLSAPKGHDAKGNAETDVLATVSVRDGDYVTPPEIGGSLHIPDSMYFIGWSEGAADPVTADMILIPVLGCVMDADEVIPSLPGGLYAEGTELTLHAADTSKLIVRYRFNTEKGQGNWTDYDIKHSPALTVSSACVLEIQAASPNKNTKRASYSYTTVSSGSVPAAPTLNSAEQTGTRTVKVTWSKVKNAKGYILTRVSDCGEVCTHILTGTSFEDTGLRSQRTYTYSVTAFLMSEKNGGTFLLESPASKSASVYFYGAAKPVTKIKVKGVTEVYSGSSVQLQTEVSPTDAAEKGVYWTVDSGSAHGSVSSEGVFTAYSAGTVTVSARAVDGSGVSGSLNITVKEPEKNQAALTVSSVSARGGSTAVVTVALGENSNVGTTRFTITYNSSKMTLKSAKKGALMANESPSIGTKSSGQVTFSYDGDAITDGGTLLTLTFNVKSSATGSAYVQIMTKEEGYTLEVLDRNGRAVDLAIKNGSVTVYGMLLGDVDDNGVVDVEDAYLVRSYINKDISLTDEQKLAADVNGDGKIDANDITLIRQYVVKLITVFPAED